MTDKITENATIQLAYNQLQTYKQAYVNEYKAFTEAEVV